MEGITQDEYGNISFVGKEAVSVFQMVAQKHAMMLEAKGIRHSRGSVTAHVKRQYGFKGNRESVIAQLQALIEEVTSA